MNLREVRDDADRDMIPPLLAERREDMIRAYPSKPFPFPPSLMNFPPQEARNLTASAHHHERVLIETPEGNDLQAIVVTPDELHAPQPVAIVAAKIEP